MKNKSIKLYSFLLILGLFFLSGCVAIGGTSDQSTLEEIQEEGTVTIGFANEQPYAYQTADGELTGVSVEIARIIMEELGVTEAEGVLTDFSSLIPGLQAHRFDMATAGMFITPQRASADQVQFANPEFSIGQGIAVQDGNPLDLHSYSEIAESDAVVAVPSGTVEYDYLLQSGVPESRIVTVPDIASALAALQAGRADAITATGPAIRSVLENAQDPSLQNVDDFEQPVIDGQKIQDYGATVFRSDDQALVDAFNRELREMQESGELLEIYQEFGFSEENLPGDTTLEDVMAEKTGG